MSNLAVGRRLIALHGYEDEPSSLAPLLELAALARSTTVVCPQGPAVTPKGPAWFADDGDGLDPDQVAAAVAVVHDAMRDPMHEGEPSMVLAGFSQGAAVALAVAFHPDVPVPLHAVVLFAPFLLPPDVTPYQFESRPPGGVHIVHGDDDDVVPLPLGRAAGKLLERQGIDVTVHTITGVGHDLRSLCAAAATNNVP